jgi:O-antigen ligase
MALAVGPLLSSRFGLQPNFFFGLLGIPLVFTAIYFLPPVSLTWAVRQFKRILLFYAYGSLAAALLAPRWAVENPYTAGLIPGFDIRLHGLVLHANLLSPYLLTYLILGWYRPSRTRWANLHQVVVLLALVLTQSKTVWIVFVLVYLIRLAYAAWGLPGLQRYTALALLGTLFSAGTLYLANGPAWLESVEITLSGEDVTTLTGRTLIWQVTLNMWERNPLFGYGPDLWDAKMGLAYAPVVGFAAPHAHSQFYQSLGEAGIIGVVGLLVYAMALLAYGVLYGNATNGVASALVAAMLLRGITEPTLDMTPGNSGFFVHFSVFAFLMLVSRQKSALDENFRGTHGERSLSSVLARGEPPAAKQIDGRI